MTCWFQLNIGSPRILLLNSSDYQMALEDKRTLAAPAIHVSLRGFGKETTEMTVTYRYETMRLHDAVPPLVIEGKTIGY